MPAGWDGKTERRAEARRRTLKSGRLFSDDFRTELECAIRDLSSRGARLKLEGNLLLPPSCFLYFETDRTIAPVRVVWRIETDVGVQFDAPPAPASEHRSRVTQGLGAA